MKQIEWFGTKQFQYFLNECVNEKFQRSRLKVLERRAIDEQRNKIRSAGLRASLQSYYNADNILVTMAATYEDKVNALNNIFGIRS